MQEISSRSLDFSGGLTGCRVISGITAVVGGFQGFVINSDAVVAQVLDPSGVDITSALGLTGVTIRQGMLITAAKGSHFSSITLTSGSVIAYLK